MEEDRAWWERKQEHEEEKEPVQERKEEGKEEGEQDSSVWSCCSQMAEFFAGCGIAEAVKETNGLVPAHRAKAVVKEATGETKDGKRNRRHHQRAPWMYHQNQQSPEMMRLRANQVRLSQCARELTEENTKLMQQVLALQERLNCSVGEGLAAVSSSETALNPLHKFPTVEEILPFFTAAMGDLRLDFFDSLDHSAPDSFVRDAKLSQQITYEACNYVDVILQNYLLDIERICLEETKEEGKEERTKTTKAIGTDVLLNGPLKKFLRVNHEMHTHPTRMRAHATALAAKLWIPSDASAVRTKLLTWLTALLPVFWTCNLSDLQCTWRPTFPINETQWRRSFENDTSSLASLASLSSYPMIVITPALIGSRGVLVKGEILFLKGD